MKKTDSYNKYVPLFIDNYAEQRSAKLRARMGWAGYGIYLAILQRLRSEKECVLELDYESLAFSFWTDEETLRTIIEDFGLFTINREKGCFFSPLLDEMLLSIDPALAKARNKKKGMEYPANEDITHDTPRKSAKKGVLEGENSMEYPANEDITHDSSRKSAKKGVLEGENSMEYPANEDITHDISQKFAKKDVLEGENSVEYPANEDITHGISPKSGKKGVLEGENSMEYPANEDITHDISHDSAEKDFSDDENSTEYPANEDITSNPHACVRVNEQTNEQTNEQEKEERRKIFSLPSLFSEEEGSGTQTDEEVKTCEDESGSTKACSDSCERKAEACPTTLKVPVKRSVAMPKKGSVRGVRGARRRTPVYLNPPTVEEVAAYAKYLGYTDFQADRFVAYYAANGWKTTRHDMMNWHAAVSTWHLNQCRYAEERAQQAQQKAQEKERRELQYQQDREWRNRVFLERNASQEQQDRLFHQQRQQFLQQQVVAAVTSVRDKYELPPEVPF